MDNIFVRVMTKEDIEQVVVIEQEAFSLPWSAKGFEESLELKYSRFYVAVVDGEVAGYVGTYFMADEVDITNVAVASKYRRRGLADKLLDAVLGYSKEIEATAINLEVRPSNIPARSLYEKYGFEELGLRKNFYTKPVEDGLIMRKDLSN